MKPTNHQVDPYLGLEISGYHLAIRVGRGKIGAVYKAERTQGPSDVLACKVIGEGKLRAGWERELDKVVRLRNVPGVVQYHSHGRAVGHDQRPFTWVMWNFVDGISLADYLRDKPWPIEMAFAELIFETILRVLLACCSVEISHGDIHPGNILISEPDSRLMDSPRRVWVSDFGYGGSHNKMKPKDDFRQLVNVTAQLLDILDPAELGARDRIMRERLHDFLHKRVLESDATQGAYAGDPKTLLQEFMSLQARVEKEVAAGYSGTDIRQPGDYLWAEALGYRVDEWRELFVPEFLGAQELLSRNITVLTGARGCGKTMTFRRLTAYMDRVIGEPSGVPHADQFIGFYLNCRDLAEAFPWIPPNLGPGHRQQIMHYFHLAWLAEIFKTLAIYDSDGRTQARWLDPFLAHHFERRYLPLPEGASRLTHARAFVESEKERCRRSHPGNGKDLSRWPLARTDFLDDLQSHLEADVPWIGDKPLFFFIDDYTMPTVVRDVQRILNPVIFRRRSKLFFKVSTEASNSFDTRALHNKPLELGQDFALVDLATESLHQDERAKTELLDRVFRRRIDRHPSLRGMNLGLQDVLGDTPLSNNELARQLRAKKRVQYSGVGAFVGMWTSDIRIMIQMFTDMLREANDALAHGAIPIDPVVQDRAHRARGGGFLNFAESLQDPAIHERLGLAPPRTQSYGKHLRSIAEALIRVSRYELSQGPLISNEGAQNPKQAFRVEIVDEFALPEDVTAYYQGLIRWHIFLQDWRGKSVRGMITPRLYLNRILIPFGLLTFSSHDSLSMNNSDFVELLRDPTEFPGKWEKKRLSKATRSGETSLSLPLYGPEE